MSMRKWLNLAWVFIALLMVACIPSTSATIELGAGHSSAEMDNVDALLEKSGFTRTWFSGSNGERVARIERDGKVISAFATEAPRGLGAGVIWDKNAGTLKVEFSEYDTHFTERGNALLQALLSDLQVLYGEKVTLVK